MVSARIAIDNVSLSLQVCYIITTWNVLLVSVAIEIYNVQVCYIITTCNVLLVSAAIENKDNS